MNFENYLSAIEKALKLGNATEHTHRPALKTLVESFGKVVATNEPKRIDCGAPDYIVAKDVGKAFRWLKPVASSNGIGQV